MQRFSVDIFPTLLYRKKKPVDEEEVLENCREQAKKLWRKNRIDV